MTGYRFKPSRWATLATLALLPVFLFAGTWQLDRAAAKRELRERQADRAAGATLPVGAQPLLAEDEFRPAAARGRYEARHLALLDNRVYRGRAGYHVLLPLALDGAEQRLLVNLGWIPAAADRRHLPAVRVPAGSLAVHGRLRRPAAPGLRLGGDPRQPGSPVWQHLDLAAMEAAFGYALQPLVLELDPEAGDAGFVRDWPVFGDSWVERHHAYAFQWFALAAALLAVYLALNTRRIAT
jgi:surfeit locus 1 family protein